MKKINTSFLSEYKRLAVGQQIRTECPECLKGKTLSVTRKPEGLMYHCYRCGDKVKGFHKIGKLSLAEQRKFKNRIFEEKEIKLPSDYTQDYPDDMQRFLLKYGLYSEAVAKFGVGYSPYLDCVVYPLYDEDKNLKGIQYRALHDVPGMPKYVTKGHKPPYIGLNSDSRTLVITEDILSAIKVNTWANTLCLLGTSLSLEHKKFISNNKDKFDKVITWLDNDAAGSKGVREVKQFLGLVGIKHENVVTQRDPKDAFYKEIKDKVGG